MLPWLNVYEKNDATFLFQGFSSGFRIPFDAPFTPRISSNHKSALFHPDIVTKKLEKEINLGRVAGPFSEPPFNGQIIVSPIGLVEKKSGNDYRLIFDLSHPKTASINSGIDHSLCTVQYASFDKAVDMVLDLGKGAFLSKIDIESAFRLLPIHPDDFRLLGMTHLDQYYVDKTLPFGCSISCAHFERFSSFLEASLRKHTNSSHWMHYLDDFLTGDKNKEKAEQTKEKALQLFEHFGVPYAEEKLVGPVTCIMFLGLEIDTIEMVIRLPIDKIKDLVDQIDYFISKYQAKITLKELQSLIGKLNFACRAIRPGRAFCRRVINSTIGLTLPFHHARVTSDMMQDLLIWKEFLNTHNGTTMILPKEWSNNQTLRFYTDSSGAHGFGIFFDGSWVSAPWPDNMSVNRKQIAYLELFPILVALLIWSPVLKNKKIYFHCDNMAVVEILNKQSSKDKDCMALLRPFVLTCLNFNIVFKAQFIEGSKNNLADALSRLQLARFRSLCPTADEKMTPIPQSAWNLLGRKSLD